jgi:MFS family permease
MAIIDEQPVAQQDEISFQRLIGTSIVAKLLVDTGTQIFSPFLSIIAPGLGTNVVTIGRLLGLRSAMGLFAPYFGVYADRHGYRRTIRLGLLLNVIGMFVIGASTNVFLAAVGMVAAGLGIACFVPNLHAYLSARLPYSLRARGLGMVEYSWALTGIIGLYAVGLVIEVSGWRMPFFILGVGMLIMWYVFGFMPATRTGAPEREAISSEIERPALGRRIRAFLHLGAHARSTYSVIVAGALNYFAAMQVMITYGAWLGTEYMLTPKQLGMIALIFGFFDLAASVSVSIFTDQIGKKRSVIIGTVGALLGYIMMPFFNTGVVPAIIGIGIARGFFEFAIVSNFPLLSEQVPEQRGKVMTLGTAIGLLGAMVAGFSGPWLYTQYGVAGMAAASILGSLLALIIYLTLVQEYGA